MAACAAASEQGARVLLIEAAPRTGGSTALSGGVFYAAGTSLQAEAGVVDPGTENMYQYYMALNQFKLEASLVRRLCYEAAANFEWLRRIGVVFRVEDLYCAGVDKVRRGHRAMGGGAAITDAIEGSFGGLAVDALVNTRVERLLFNGDRVTGVSVAGTEVTANAVVIATGGFGANTSKLAELYPDAAQHGSLHWYIGAKTCRGDGLDLGKQAGAVLTRHNRGLLLLSPNFDADLEPYLPGWLMFVNADGQRFIDESVEYSVLSSVVNDLPRRECYALFDEDARLGSRVSAYRPAPSWTADRLQQSAADGTLFCAPTLEGLAGLLDMPPSALVATVERYNHDVRKGFDQGFFKAEDMLRLVAKPPFYAAVVRASVICWTGVGLKIDSNAHVLDASGTPILGLYAAGETTGGMFGECYPSGRASIGNAIVFGRIAGAGAASFSRTVN